MEKSGNSFLTASDAVGFELLTRLVAVVIVGRFAKLPLVMLPLLLPLLLALTPLLPLDTVVAVVVFDGNVAAPDIPAAVDIAEVALDEDGSFFSKSSAFERADNFGI